MKPPLRPALAAIALLSACRPVEPRAVPEPGRPLPASFERALQETVRLRYLIRLPADYPAGGPRPLLLFLHGAGERGDDLSKLAALGPLGYASRHLGFPFIVAAPQCPVQQAWSPRALGALLDELQSRFEVDADRVYLTGFSMGGWGTWETAMSMSGRFAAIAPLCGRAIPLLSGNLWKTPVWAFHGERDDVVPPANSREMIGILRGMGNTEAKLTTFPEAGHEIWGQVYEMPELYRWLLGHRRPALR